MPCGEITSTTVLTVPWLFVLFRISEEEYVASIKEEINKVVKLQEELDIDVLVHGEPEVSFTMPNGSKAMSPGFELHKIFYIFVSAFLIAYEVCCISYWIGTFVFVEERHGWVLWRAIIRFRLHCQWVGAILWISLCEATHHLWWCEPSQGYDRLLVLLGSEHDCSPNEGNAYWPCHHSQLVLCQKWPAQVYKWELVHYWLTFWNGNIV